MNFATVHQSRHRRVLALFGQDSSAQQLYCYFPAAPGARPTAFPNAIVCQEGVVPGANKDVTGLLNRRNRTTTITFLTADLPAAFLTSGRERIPTRQNLRLGTNPETALAWEVSATASQAGVTQLELELVA